MMDGKCCFIDTNVLLTATDASRSNHAAALSFLEAALEGRQRLFASGQILREYLVVATRPTEVNGLGLNPSEALENIQEFQNCVQRLDENADGETIPCFKSGTEELNGNPFGLVIPVDQIDDKCAFYQKIRLGWEACCNTISERFRHPRFAHKSGLILRLRKGGASTSCRPLYPSYFGCRSTG